MIPIITIRDGELVINRTEILSIKEFKKVATRVKGMPGDSDGRKKLLNTLELQFVKYYAETRLHSASIYAGMPDSEKTVKIAQDIGLPDDWIPDDDVKDAIKKYVEILNDYIPSARVLNSFERGLAVIAQSNHLVISRLSEYLGQLENINQNIVADDGSIDAETVVALTAATTAVQSSVGEFVKLAKNLPDLLDTINKLRDDVRKEEGGVMRKRGNKEIGRREIPK